MNPDRNLPPHREQPAGESASHGRNGAIAGGAKTQEGERSIALPDELKLEKLLVDYDETLAAGGLPTATATMNVPEALRDELNGLRECLALLHAVVQQGDLELPPSTEPSKSGMSADHSLAPLAGEQIGRFELIRELGRGGYGVVFLARDPRLDRLVALKVPRPEALVAPELRRRFLREAQAAGRLSHAHLVQVHEVGEDGALCYLVSEYCPGPSLAGWLRESDRPAPIRDSAALVADLADALDHAHREGVLHRDIKPGNVLLEPIVSGREQLLSANTMPLSSYAGKVADFGLAKLLAVNDNETRSGALLGTPAYMPPEQAAGRQDRIGPTADVYGLGAILYELLAGRAPFVGSSDAETLHQVVSDEPVAPRKLRPDVPADLEAICLKCLEKESGSRYASCAALADDLRRFLAGVPTRARPAGAVERLLKWSRRRPSIAALLAVSLLAVVTIVGGSAIFSRRLLVALDASEASRLAEATARQDVEASRNEALRARDANEQYAYAARVQQGFHALGQGDVAQVGKLLANYDEGTPYVELRGFEWHYLKQSLHGERQMLRGHAGEVYGVAFSPDGRLLVSGGADGTIRLWDTQTGQDLRAISAHASCTNDLEFSPDGRLLASASCDGTVKIWDTSTWQEVSTFSGHNHDVLSLGFSPDGQRLASGDSSGKTCIWTVGEGKAPISIVPELAPGIDQLGAVNSIVWSPDGKLLLAPCPGDCWLWDTVTWAQVHSWPTLPSLCATFSPDGQRVAFSAGGEIAIRELATNGRSATIARLGKLVQKVAYCADGKQLLSCGDDGVVRIWTVASGDDQKLPAALRGNEQRATEVRSLIGHSARVQDMAISPDGRTLATASFDGTVGVWDLAATGESVPVLTCGVARSDSPLALAPDFSRLAVVEDKGRFVIWDVAEVRQVSSEEAGLMEDRAFFLAPDAETFVVRDGQSDVLSFGQIRNAKVLVTPAEPTGFRQVRFSADSLFVATVNLDGYLRVFDTHSGRMRYTVNGPSMGRPDWRDITQRGTCALSSTGRELALINVGDDTVIDLETGKRKALPKIEGALREFYFSPDDRLLVVSCDPGIVHLIDARTGTMLRTLRFPTNSPAIAVSPDSKTLALATDNNVTLCHVETGQEMTSLRVREESGDIVKLQFSADGRKLAAVTARQVDAGTGEASLYVW